MKPEQLREWAGAIEGEKPWAPKVADVCDQLREHAAALEEIERLKVLAAEAPWQRAGVDDWRCRECWATVCRGIYPTAFGHAAHCSHSIRDVVDRAEKAERRAERLKGHAEAMAEHMAKAIVVVGWPEEQSYGDEWSHDADRIIAAYRADKGE